MTVQVLTYPFLFLAIFFEAFVLVTFLSKPAGESRKVRAAFGGAASVPSVAVIVPCWNEGKTVAATADSLLALDYPAENLEIILVDNASTDETSAVMARYADHPQVRVIREAKRGKHNAVNAGIALTQAEFIGCLDADSFVEKSALRESVAHFTSPDIAAVTAGMSVHKPGNWLQHMQNAEYIFGITRQNALAVVHGVHVTPGPFSLYRRSAVLEAGGFRHGHQTEDLEMALRLQRYGYHIANAPRARVYTKAPATILKLIKQRTRWTSGYMRNTLNEYRDMVGNPRYGALGLITLPLGTLTTVTSVLLFFVLLYEMSKRLVSAVSMRIGVPLSYSLAPHAAWSWFYLPASVYSLLALLTIAASIALILIGQRISKTPGPLLTGIASYVFLYLFIAPLWVMRASADVALGKTRGWR